MPRSFPFFRPVSIFAALVLGAGLALRVLPSAAEGARAIPPPVLDEPANPQTTSEVAILAGGCFWGVQGVFQHVEGVANAVSGYAGGAADTAHYEMVSTNTTGHAESVRVTLQIYFSVAHAAAFTPGYFLYEGRAFIAIGTPRFPGGSAESRKYRARSGSR